MAPEYGATAAMFFIDEQDHRLPASSPAATTTQVKLVETYAKHAGLWADALKTAQYERVLKFDLSTVVRNMAGPSNPHKRLPTSRSRRARHRRQVGRGAGPDAGRRGDHRRDHQLHQHQQPAQRDRGGPAGAQRQRARPDAQAVGEVLAGAGLQDRAAVPRRSEAAARTGAARLRHRRVRLHDLQRHVAARSIRRSSRKSSTATCTRRRCCRATATSTAASIRTRSRRSSPRRRWSSPMRSPARCASTSRRTCWARTPTASRSRSRTSGRATRRSMRSSRRA